MPSFGDKVQEIKKYNELKFQNLDLESQCNILNNMMKVTKCNAETGDISILVPKSSHLGKPTMPEDIMPRYSAVALVNQSPTGLYEEIVDLKTVQPKINKQGEN
jgi:hypothetical protein